MSDEAREHIRAAQAAELRGDKRAAAVQLRQAAEVYQRRGAHQRALQMLQYAAKLVPDDAELAERVARLQAGADDGDDAPVRPPRDPDAPARWAEGPPVPPAEDDPHLAPLRRPVPGPSLEEDPHQLTGRAGRLRAPVERGVTRAAPDQDAWCSFCCRPRQEAGELVTGPTGAFICAKCLRESLGLVGGAAPAAEPARTFGAQGRPPAGGNGTHAALVAQEARARLVPDLPAGVERVMPLSTDLSEADAVELVRTEEFDDPVATRALAERAARKAGKAPTPVRPATPAPAPAKAAGPEVPFVGQAAAQALLARALARGATRLLVVGPEGSGKSTWLRALEAQGLGTRAEGGRGARLVDDAERLPVDALHGLLDGADTRAVVLAVRTRGPMTPALTLAAEDGALLPVYASAELAAATGLPVQVLERVQGVVALASPDVRELAEVARRLLAATGGAQLPDDALEALAAVAARSPRGGHELRALLQRIPPGRWALPRAPGAAKAPKAPARRARKAPRK